MMEIYVVPNILLLLNSVAMELPHARVIDPALVEQELPTWHSEPTMF